MSASEGACVSASTSATWRPPRASSTASSVATVDRPGAPAAPQTAITRGCGRGAGAGADAAGPVESASAMRHGSMCRLSGRLQPARGGDTLPRRVVDQRHDPCARAVAEGDDGRRHRRAGHRDDQGVGVGERPQQRLGVGAQHPIGRSEGGGRGGDHRDHVDAFAAQSLDEEPCVVHGDDDLHEPAPIVGTTERADSSDIAASVAGTSALGMTSSRAAAPPPIIESSRVTDTTVASATRMRGSS